MAFNDQNAPEVFLSYNTSDHAIVERIARDLARRGVRCFMDRWYLIPGDSWVRALEEALAKCRAALVFIGPNGLGSWQQRERDLALDRQAKDADFRVIPVLLPRSDPVLGFLSINMWVDFREAIDGAELDHIVAAIRHLDTEPHWNPAKSTVATICPFRGLLPFREEDAPFFFGREQYIGQLVEAVEARTFVAVVGSSGCGKSSVVRAGLLPRLRGSPETVWEIATMVPTDQPFRSLANTLSPLLWPDKEWYERSKSAIQLGNDLSEGKFLLRDTVDHVLQNQPGTQRILFVVDQWEELYTVCRAPGMATAFIDQLLELTRDAPANVVLTVRGDFFGRVLEHRELVDRLRDAVVQLGPMNREELLSVMERPADKVGLSFEPGLTARILDDVGDEPGYLPMLEFVLKALWDERRDTCLTNDSYDKMGEIHGAIARRAEHLYKHLSSFDQEVARKLFIQLVRVGDESEDTRRRALVSTLGEAAKPVISKLVDERLLVTGRDDPSNDDFVEVSHEALIRHWSRLAQWIDASRGFLHWRRSLEPFLDAWRKDPSAVLQGGMLAEAERWLAERGNDLDPGEKQFIGSSRSAHQQNQERREQELRDRMAAVRRISRLSKAVALAASLGILVGLALGTWVYLERENLKTVRATAGKELKDARTASKQAATDLATAKAASARASTDLANANKARRELLVKQAMARRQSTDPGRRLESINHLKEAITLGAGGELRDEYIRSLNTFDYHPRTNLSEIKLITQLDPETGERLIPGISTAENPGIIDGASLRSHAAIGADSSRLMIVPAYGSVFEVDSSSGKVTAVHRYLGRVHAPASVSPDLRYALFSRKEKNELEVWDLVSRRRVGSLSVPEQFKDRAQVVVVGKNHLAIALKDPQKKQVYLGIYDTSTLSLRTSKTIDSERCDCLLFSPDESLLAASFPEPIEGLSHTIVLLGVEDGTINRRLTLELEFRGGGFSIQAQPARLGFSRDGRLLAAAGRHGTVKLWQVAGRAVQASPVLTLQAGSEEVLAVAISPEGNWLATANDLDLKIWDLNSGTMAIYEHTPGRGFFYGIAWSPDGQSMILNYDSGLRVLKCEFPISRHYAFLARLTGAVESVGFDENERWLACGHEHGISPVLIDLQDANSPPLEMASGPGVSSDSGDGFKFVGISPRGDRLVASSLFGLRAWNLKTRKPETAKATRDFTRSYIDFAFNDKGELIAAGTERGAELTIVDTRTGEACTRLESGTASYGPAPMFAPDGSTLVAAVSTPTSTKIRTLGCNAGHIDVKSETSVASKSPFNSFFLRKTDVMWLEDSEKLIVRSLSSVGGEGSLREKSGDSTWWQDKLVFSADGYTIAEAGDKGEIRIWSLRKRARTATITRDDTSMNKTLALSPDGQRVCAMDGRHLKVWATEDGREIGKVGQAPVSFAFDAGNASASRVLLISSEGNVMRWSTEESAVTRVCELARPHDHWFRFDQRFAFSEDRKVALVALSGYTDPEYNGAFVWDLSSGELVRWYRLDYSSGTQPEYAVNHDGSLIVVQRTADIGKVWNVDSNQELMSLGETGHVAKSELRLSRDAQHVAIAREAGALTAHVTLWKLDGKKALATMPPLQGVRSIAVSPEGNRLAIARENSILVRDVGVSNWRELKGHGDTVSDIAFDGSGRLLVSVSDRERRFILWNLQSGVALAHFEVTAKYGPQRAALSRGANWLATGGTFGEVQLWDIGSVVRELKAVGIAW